LPDLSTPASRSVIRMSNQPGRDRPTACRELGHAQSPTASGEVGRPTAGDALGLSARLTSDRRERAVVTFIRTRLLSLRQVRGGQSAPLSRRAVCTLQADRASGFCARL
jgi:hypothetical protein